MKDYLSVLTSSICLQHASVAERSTQSAEEVPLISLSCEAMRRCIDKYDKEVRSVIVGSALGSLSATCRVLEKIIDPQKKGSNAFMKIMHIGMAEEIADNFHINGPVLTVSDSQNTLATAIKTASLLNDNDFPAAVCIVDEHAPIIDVLYPYFSPRCRRYLNNDWNTTATAFILDREHNSECAAIKAYGPLPANRQKPKDIFRKILHDFHPEFRGEFLFEESNQSFIRTAELIHTRLQNSICHFIAGSYSPTSGAVSLVEIRKP